MLSLGQLSEKGYDLQFKYGIGTITDNRLGLIAKVYMNTCRLWPITLNCHDLPYFSSVVLDDIWLWYMHFGHLNFGSLCFLVRQNMLYGLLSIDFSEKHCEFCAQLRYLPMGEVNILLFSLKILVRKLGYIFWRINLKLMIFLRVSKCMLKSKVVNLLKFWEWQRHWICCLW